MNFNLSLRIFHKNLNLTIKIETYEKRKIMQER
jgi:hypothetical protein